MECKAITSVYRYCWQSWRWRCCIGLLMLIGLIAIAQPGWGAHSVALGADSSQRALHNLARQFTDTPTPSITPTPTPTNTGTPPTTTPTTTGTPPTPTPTNTGTPPTPTATLTPGPTSTPAPSATPLPSATFTSLPTATSTGTAVPTATPLPPQIMVFKVEPNPITAGESATIYWQVLAADGVLLRGPEGEKPIGPVGNLLVQPIQNANYTLVARNGSGEVVSGVDITVNPAVPTAVPMPTTGLLTNTIASPLVTPVTVISATTNLTTTITGTNLLTPRTALEATPLYTTTSLLPTPPSAPLATRTLITDVRTLTDLAPIALATIPPVTLTPVTDPVLAQNRLLAFFGGVAVAVVTPLVLLLLVGLFWLLRSSK